MRNAGFFIVGTLVAGLVAFAGCSSSATGTGATTSTTTHTTTSSHTSGSTTTTATTGGTGGTTGTGGSTTAGWQCTVPAKPPSNGSCVTVTGLTDGGAELDAGLDDGGAASITTCNPVTNAGCTGADVCNPDLPNNKHYICQGGGSPAGITLCGDCTADTATCGPDLLCVGDSGGNTYTCVQMCCTDADCGTGKCSTMELQDALPSGVGLCITM
jgi:hypothetical protein